MSRSNGTTLSYDPNGRLWQISGPSETVRFVYDGDRLIEEYDGGGNRLRAYAHGPGADEPLVWYELTGGQMRRFLHADHQGSIIGLTDEYGNLLHANAYDAWGIRNAGDWGRFAYTGQVWLADLGMYYYKARIYSPTLGRFLQTDPIGYEDQVNLYAYVGNDPVARRDPSGKCLEDPKTHNRSGVCGNTQAEKDFIAERLADKNSQISQVEAAAIKSGNLVEVNFTMNDPYVYGSGVEAGMKPGDSVVTFDLAETVRIDNLDSKGAVTGSRIMSLKELAEHEIAGHAWEAIKHPESPRGRGVDERPAIDAENRYRDKAGIPFHRNYNATGKICDSRGQCH